MDLLLTSSPCENNVPSGLDLPCIFFSRNGFTDILTEICPKNFRLTVIAASPEAYAMNDEMLETFSNCFDCCGLKPGSSVIIDRRNEINVPELIKDSDFIILGGGHVPTQNAFFRQIQLKEQLCSFNGTLMGISAGSMNCARTVYAIPEEAGEAVDPAYQRFIPGLALTDIMIIPHMNRLKDVRVDGQLAIGEIAVSDSMQNTFYALEDSSYILQRNGQAPVIRGKAWRIHAGYADQVCDIDLELNISSGRISKL